MQGLLDERPNTLKNKRLHSELTEAMNVRSVLDRRNTETNHDAAPYPFPRQQLLNLGSEKSLGNNDLAAQRSLASVLLPLDILSKLSARDVNDSDSSASCCKYKENGWQDGQAMCLSHSSPLAHVKSEPEDGMGMPNVTCPLLNHTAPIFEEEHDEKKALENVKNCEVEVPDVVRLGGNEPKNMTEAGQSREQTEQDAKENMVEDALTKGKSILADPSTPSLSPTALRRTCTTNVDSEQVMGTHPSVVEGKRQFCVQPTGVQVAARI